MVEKKTLGIKVLWFVYRSHWEVNSGKEALGLICKTNLAIVIRCCADVIVFALLLSLIHFDALCVKRTHRVYAIVMLLSSMEYDMCVSWCGNT